MRSISRTGGILAVTALAAALTAHAPPADAFCGFYVSGADSKLFNNATQVVLLRDGTRTVLSMQNNYQGPPEDFAMVVPVPVVLQKENVKTLAKALFEHVDQLDSPRLVEYWEQDPCPEPMDDRLGSAMRAKGGGAAPQSMALAAPQSMQAVKIEAEFTVGEYDVVVLSATDSSALDRWLRDNHYKIPEGSEPLLRPYVENGSKFFVAKVDVKKVTFEGGQAALSPLRFHYDTEAFSLPVRLGLVNSGGKQDLVIHVLARNQRYEAANYKNATIPTNLDVDTKAKDGFATYYSALFDRTVEEHPGAVITEYSWASSTCDPCPGPALAPQEIQALGGDVAPSATAPMGRGMSPGAWDWVVTRLHARYTKDTLGEDIVFRAAPPIVGGREVRGSDGKLESGASASGINNFQGRYAIRHPWTGPVKCASPQRGVWGGPPGEPYGRPAVMAALNPSFTRRGPTAQATPPAPRPVRPPPTPLPATPKPPGLPEEEPNPSFHALLTDEEAQQKAAVVGALVLAVLGVIKWLFTRD
ncbi:MAG: DUF2330 domain-containing protein [Polyangiaceae bacterium]